MKKTTPKAQKYEIISNNMVAKDHFRVTIKAKWMAEKAIPGQFVQVKVRDTGTDPLLRIPLGIHRTGEETISLLYKVIGTGTRILSTRRQGEMLDIIGPLGNGFQGGKDPGTGKAALISGGHGVAPLFFLAQKMRENGEKVDFYVGACEKKHVLCEKELEALGVNVYVATECGRAGYKGYVTELAEKNLENARGSDPAREIYACGPRPMLEAVNAVSRRLDIPCRVSLDEYMACGIGVCLGCAVATKSGYKYICKDGPVFNGNEIDWREKGGRDSGC